MIKFMGERNGRVYLGLVLTKANLERLQQDMPIHFHVEQMGIDEIRVKEVVIIYSETEEKFHQEAVAKGLITKETKIKEDKLEKSHH